MKKNIFNKIVNSILTERNMARQIANNIIQNVNTQQPKQKAINKNVGNKQNTSYNSSNKLASPIIDTITRKRNDGTTFNIKVEAGSHARYRISAREVDLKSLINIVRTAAESIIKKNMSQQVIVDKQTCYVIPIIFDSSDMTIFLKTVSIFDGKQSYPIKKNASDTTVLNKNNPSNAWEEAKWIYENYGDKSIRGGGDPHHPSFIYKNYEFNPDADTNGLRHGMPTTYKGYLALTDKEKKFVANQVKRKAVNTAYDTMFNTLKTEKEKQMNDMWTDYFKKQNMKENKNVIRLSQKQLNEVITETIDTLISEGLLDNMRSGFNNAKSALSRFADGYETKEGNPQSIEDVFEGDGWKIHATVPKKGATYYFVSRQTGALGAFYGQEVNEMVEELNTFLGGNRAKYIGKYPEKKYLEVFRIA